MPDESSSGLVRESYRALFWKEWRESRWLFLATVLLPAGSHALALIMPGEEFRDLYISFPIGFFIVFALTLGAGLFASERSRGTQAFLMQKPVQAGAIWKSKIIMPLAALFLSYVLYAVVFELFSEGWAKADDFYSGVLIFVIAMSLSVFSVAALMSSFVERPVIAWAGGGVLWAGIMFLSVFILNSFTTAAMVASSWFAVIVLAVWASIIVFFLYLSRVVFLRSTRG